MLPEAGLHLVASNTNIEGEEDGAYIVDGFDIEIDSEVAIQVSVIKTCINLKAPSHV